MRAVFLIALSLLVACSQPKQTLNPEMTIRAVAPSGDSFYVPPQPIWRFAITNTGDCYVAWEAFVETCGEHDQDYSNAGGFIEWPEGILAPGESLMKPMIVPAKTEIAWRAALRFWPLTATEANEAKQKYAQYFGGFPEPSGSSESHFAPRRSEETKAIHDEWHQ